MVRLNFAPKEAQVESIEKWLFEEWDTLGKGFYCNIDIIKDAFEEKKILIVEKDTTNIGFIVYRENGLIAVVDIIEVKPSERGKGIGKLAVSKLLNYFKNKGIIVVELFCSPESSFGFWKRIGFERFDDFYNQTRINMYKTLTKTLKESPLKKSNTILKLWSCEPHSVKNELPFKSWNLTFKEDNVTLSNPIVLPVNNEWYMELIENEGYLYKGKIKRFKHNFGLYSGFLVIKKIK